MSASDQQLPPLPVAHIVDLARLNELALLDALRAKGIQNPEKFREENEMRVSIAPYLGDLGIVVTIVQATPKKEAGK